jgi:hypothetical protein
VQTICMTINRPLHPLSLLGQVNRESVFFHVSVKLRLVVLSSDGTSYLKLPLYYQSVSDVYPRPRLLSTDKSVLLTIYNSIHYGILL